MFDERTISKGDAAHRLSVSDATITRMVKDGRLKGYHVAGRLRILESSLERYVAEAMANA